MDLLQAEAGKARWAAQEMIDLIANANYYARVSADPAPPHNVQSCCRASARPPCAIKPKGVLSG